MEWRKSNAQAPPFALTTFTVTVALGFEFRRREFEGGELESGCNRTPNQRPGTKAVCLLPGVRRYDGLWTLYGGEIGSQGGGATPAPSAMASSSGAPAYQCQASAASTRCQRDTSPSRSRK